MSAKSAGFAPVARRLRTSFISVPALTWLSVVRTSTSLGPTSGTGTSITWTCPAGSRRSRLPACPSATVVFLRVIVTTAAVRRDATRPPEQGGPRSCLNGACHDTTRSSRGHRAAGRLRGQVQRAPGRDPERDGEHAAPPVPRRGRPSHQRRDVARRAGLPGAARAGNPGDDPPGAGAAAAPRLLRDRPGPSGPGSGGQLHHRGLGLADDAATGPPDRARPGEAGRGRLRAGDRPRS